MEYLQLKAWLCFVGLCYCGLCTGGFGVLVVLALCTVWWCTVCEKGGLCDNHYTASVAQGTDKWRDKWNAESGCGPTTGGEGNVLHWRGVKDYDNGRCSCRTIFSFFSVVKEWSHFLLGVTDNLRCCELGCGFFGSTVFVPLCRALQEAWQQLMEHKL